MVKSIAPASSFFKPFLILVIDAFLTSSPSFTDFLLSLVSHALHSAMMVCLVAGDFLTEYSFTNFSILDGTDQAKILQNVLKALSAEKRFNARQLLYMISAYKNTKAVEGEFDTSSLTDPHLFMQVYNAYEKEKRDSHSLDFDDLLVYTLDLFKDHS